MSPGVKRFVREGDIDHESWKRALREGVLLGQACEECGHVTAAPKAACVQCGSFELTVERLPTTGEVYTETTVAVPPEPFEGSYQVALVDIGDARVMAHVDGEVKIGDEVELRGAVEEDDDPAPLFG